MGGVKGDEEVLTGIQMFCMVTIPIPNKWNRLNLWRDWSSTVRFYYYAHLMNKRNTTTIGFKIITIFNLGGGSLGSLSLTDCLVLYLYLWKMFLEMRLWIKRLSEMDFLVKMFL